MGVKELGCVFAGKVFEKIFEMVKGEKLVLEDGIMLLKHVGYYKALSDIHTDNDGESSFRKRFERRVMNEEWKQGQKKEKMLNDVCECYALSYEQFVTFNFSSHVEEDVFMNSIVSVIVHHQQNRNLTQLAYQSAWQFFMKRMHTNAQMESAMSMHFGFVEEARRELEELEKRADWQRKERRVKELKDIHTILRWLKTLNKHFVNHQPSRERNTRLAAVAVGICRKARACFGELSLECLVLLEQMNESASLSVSDFVAIEAVDVF
ncbi:uncharacterized protein MONOS_15261 [Monocercomonoides exilis]|uniref:uncharacterized protein n=1 Tax=Monocercomonoides exilis TaxID=2049356 RepID=UPI00355978FB|nr:hypothetical protein MONOS_15261 [Monocercomonoides exilis]|eukprot:MONOS_15261.1-p1 / transcript=MONOS_15261.1 / gene=MONOS_15261 / organism=Monocercomonoides_exilis_PA203 / gene_product=unspecified product / transcript_product=unspecified product / location=Mono_scaffold01182:12981-13959(-) / protein_length=265 / sequence_SO=supercontig / SO=protein_coding / is_pseudo=false